MQLNEADVATDGLASAATPASTRALDKEREEKAMG